NCPTRSANSDSVRTSRAAKIVKRALCRIHHLAGRPLPQSLRSFYILGVYRRATQKYVLQAFPGSLTLFLHPATPAESYPKHWSAIATKNVEIHHIPAGHERLLKEPYIEI